jgi:hypothetical protein
VQGLRPAGEDVVEVLEPGLGELRISASLTRMRCIRRDFSCASSGGSGCSAAVFLSCAIRTAQAPSSLTTWSQLPPRAASSMSWLAFSIAW